jgi:hypothetical protein
MTNRDPFSTKVSTVILSHLQDLAYFAPSSNDFRMRSKMIQSLVFNYPNTSDRITDEQLDDMWKNIIQNINE